MKRVIKRISSGVFRKALVDKRGRHFKGMGIKNRRPRVILDSKVSSFEGEGIKHHKPISKGDLIGELDKAFSSWKGISKSKFRGSGISPIE